MRVLGQRRAVEALGMVAADFVYRAADGKLALLAPLLLCSCSAEDPSK
jgi:hypothetical protein